MEKAPGNRPISGPELGDEAPNRDERAHRYWSANKKLLLVLLLVWFVVSFGAGILFVDHLNVLQLGGFPLGFWFAQQGAIFTFIALVFYYAHHMKKLERSLDLSDDQPGKKQK